SVCLFYRADATQPHLLYQSILQRIKLTLNPTLGLRRISMDQLHCQFRQCPPKLAQRFRTVYLVLYSRLRGGFVGFMSIKIYAYRNAVFPDISLKTVHSGYRPLILIKPPVDPVCCVVYIGHEHTLRAPAFKPIMHRTVHLQHLPTMLFPCTPLTVCLPFPFFFPFPCCYKIRPNCLFTYFYAIFF